MYKIKKTAALLLNTVLNYNWTSQLVDSYEVLIIHHSVKNLLQNKISVIIVLFVIVANNLIKKSLINKLTEMMKIIILSI